MIDCFIIPVILKCAIVPYGGYALKDTPVYAVCLLLKNFQNTHKKKELFSFEYPICK